MATGVSTNHKRKSPPKKYWIEYEGKKDVEEILSRPVSSFSKVLSANNNNTFYFGDNLNVLKYLLDIGYAGKVRLIYIDPPYATNSAFLGKNQKIAYADSLGGAEYIEFLRERIILMRELLADNGSMYLHLDGNMAFPLKLIMDEIFGEKNCRAFITRKKCSTKNYTRNTFGNISDYIMFYTKTTDYVWNRPYDPWDEDRMLKEYPCVSEDGRRYKKVPIHAPGIRHGATGEEWKGMMPPAGKHWQYTPDKLTQLDEAGDIYWSPTGNPRRKVYCDPQKGIPIQDIWLNYRDSINQQIKTTGYPTEKNIDMLRMIIEASSNKNDLVMDVFAGSGTTLDAAEETERNWIGADNSPESLSAVLRRFHYGLQDYGDYVKKPFSQQQLDITDSPSKAFNLFVEEGFKEQMPKVLTEKEDKTS